MNKHLNDICGICGGTRGIHNYHNQRCPVDINANADHTEYRSTIFAESISPIQSQINSDAAIHRQGEAKWNPETQEGTYSDKTHGGEMKVGSILEQYQSGDAATIKRLMDENERLSLELEIARGRNRELVKLLREIVIRAQLDFPTTEEEYEWFKEGMKGQHDLFIKLNDVLHPEMKKHSGKLDSNPKAFK